VGSKKAGIAIAIFGLVLLIVGFLVSNAGAAAVWLALIGIIMIPVGILIAVVGNRKSSGGTGASISFKEGDDPMWKLHNERRRHAGNF